MNTALVILLYAFIFAAVLIFATDWDDSDRVNRGEEGSNDLAPPRHRAVAEDSVEIEQLDLWGGDAGSRTGDHVITSQSDLPDFDSFSDSWGDSWGHDD